MSRVIGSLRWMYNMERFATQIYRVQIRAFSDKQMVNKLQAAAVNEQQHADDLQNRIDELKGARSKVGALFQVGGALMGFITLLLGNLFILKADIWIEKRAIKDYESYLQKVDFDDNSVSLIVKIIEDEKNHVKICENSREALKERPVK